MLYTHIQYHSNYPMIHLMIPKKIIFFLNFATTKVFFVRQLISRSPGDGLFFLISQWENGVVRYEKYEEKMFYQFNTIAEI